MTNLKTLAAAAALLASGLASATTTYDAGAYTVTYDETTSFGRISSSFTSNTGEVGFEWSVNPSVNLTSLGSPVTATFALPSFTVTVNSGYTLAGHIVAKLGNLVYAEAPGSTTWITATGTFTVDGATTGLSTGVSKVHTSNFGGLFSADLIAPVGSFTSFEVSNASVTLEAAGSFAFITGQSQNKLAFSFTTTPVPEPESYALMLAGLGIMGFVARRRSQR